MSGNPTESPDKLTISPERTQIVQLAPQQSGIVRPSATVSEALEAWNQYQELCKAVLSEEDHQGIGQKKFKKKSAWRKLANFYNLTVEMVSEQRIEEADRSFSFDVTYKATAPNGRSVPGDGSANSREHSDEDNTRHNVRGTAHTRAFNRAVSNLIAAGEVSAEEVDQGRRSPTQLPPKTISEAQGKRLFAISKVKNWSIEQLKALVESYGYQASSEIRREHYDEICQKLETQAPSLYDKKTEPAKEASPPLDLEWPEIDL